MSKKEQCFDCKFFQRSVRAGRLNNNNMAEVRGLCQRFPKVEPKTGADWCGEFQAEKKTRGVRRKAGSTSGGGE